MSLVLAFVLAAAAPVTPTIIEPERNGQVVSGADVHMVTAPFSDPDGHGHRCTDWEIRRGDEVVWEARCVEGPEKIHIHMADGTFTGSSAGQRELTGGRFYRLLARQCDDSGDPATEWSAWAERTFLTSEPPVAQPMRLRDVTSPLWNVDGASLRIEQIDGVPLLRIENGLLLDEQPAASQSVVRLIVTAGESALKAPESELTFEDENARQRIIYLPSIQLEARQSAYFWVSANGSTHYAEAGSRAPNFDSIVRGAPVPWRVHERGFVVEKFATGLQLPVNIAFVANPRKENDAPFFYVAELYGDVKVVTRGGEVRDFATGLLDFDPTGAIPGSGESGLAGIAVDPESGDVFVTLVSWPDRSNRDLIPNVLRLRASDDGLKADAVELVLTLPGEKQSASHQISNITIGPDRKLYVHFGDSVRHDLAQDLSTVRGKIIRFNFDGTPAADNPFYDASDGISAKDYIFARGFRNPFGGAWRAVDQSLYSIENGPITDRMAKIVAGRNYGWDGRDETMLNYAICTWTAPSAPLQLAWVQRETFEGSGFPEQKLGFGYVTETGPTWGSGETEAGKRISEVVLAGDTLVRGPSPFVSYDGTGKATAAAIASGPDGLYFSDLYKDFGFETPIDRGANVFRIRWIGYAAFDERVVSADGLTLEFSDRSNVDAGAWIWDFGDGTSSSEPNPRHRFAQPGTYVVRLTRGEQTIVKKMRVGGDDVPLTRHSNGQTRVDDSLSFVWGDVEPFTATWTGTIVPRYSEVYRFTSESNELVEVTVGGQRILDGSTHTAEVELEAGRAYEILVHYVHEDGPAGLQVFWESESQTRLPVPRSMTLPKRRASR